MGHGIVLDESLDLIDFYKIYIYNVLINARLLCRNLVKLYSFLYLWIDLVDVYDLLFVGTIWSYCKLISNDVVNVIPIKQAVLNL